MASSWHGVYVYAFVVCWSGIRVDDHYSFQLRVRNREATIRGPRDVGRCGHEMSSQHPDDRILQDVFHGARQMGIRAACAALP